MKMLQYCYIIFLRVCLFSDLGQEVCQYFSLSVLALTGTKVGYDTKTCVT